MPKLRIGSASIAYSDTGRGFPVVLVHGSASARHQWHRLAASLAGRYRILAPDLYGCGETSAWPHARPIGSQDEAEIILALARQIGEPFHLVGHSYGGCTSLVAAPQLSGQLLSLTLIEPTTFQFLLEDEWDGDLWDEVSWLARDHIAWVRAGALRASADAFMRYWIGADAWSAVAPERQQAVAALMPKVAAEWEMMFATPLRIADFADLNRPLLLLYGGSTTRAARRICERLAAGIPGAELTQIAAANHFLPLTHVAEVRAALLPHFARSEPALIRRRIRA